MADLILVVGLAWWFGGTFFGTRHRLRHGRGAGSAPTVAKGLLYAAGGVASLSMIALALSASARLAATDAGFSVFVFGATLCAIAAGCSLGAARA